MLVSVNSLHSAVAYGNTARYNKKLGLTKELQKYCQLSYS